MAVRRGYSQKRDGTDDYEDASFHALVSCREVRGVLVVSSPCHNYMYFSNLAVYYYEVGTETEGNR